jgi:hypothetical protein
MAGYSGTPLPQKLGIKVQTRLAVVRPPDDFAVTLGPLPDGVSPRLLSRTTASSPSSQRFDVIICFVRSIAEVERDLPGLKQRLDPAGGLWMAWPKKTRSKTALKTTGAERPSSAAIGENDIRAWGLAAGLVDNKVCAIDDVWSGLRFVVRLADRVKPSRRKQPPLR